MDLADQINGWNYADTRLQPMATVTSPTDAGIQATDLGRGAVTVYNPEYGDLNASDTNVTNPARRGVLSTNYTGLSSDVLHNGSPDYVRYWNVYQYSDGTSNGLLLQIFVRWKEPSLGYRQVYITTYKTNPSGIVGL
jgi:hypothetical protein